MSQVLKLPRSFKTFIVCKRNEEYIDYIKMCVFIVFFYVYVRRKRVLRSLKKGNFW